MDKETVIKGCENWVNNHKGENFLLTYSSVVELLAILKEPEAVALEPHYIDKYGKNFICGVECGSCHKEITSTYRYCPYCGRPIKWE